MGGNLSFNLVPDETDCVLEKPLGFAQDQAEAGQRISFSTLQRN